MKKALSLIILIALFATASFAQEKTPDWKRWHYLSEEEMYNPTRGENFVETDPPAGEPRFVGEFEPMQGVMIRYPLDISTNLVAQLSNNCRVFCVVESSSQSSAQYSFQNAGVNMDNVTFVNAPTDSQWIRDYGPWYIFEDREPAIVDNIYNRSYRPNDDAISGVFANFLNIPMYGMNLVHTGGNMMEDGRGHGVSDDLVVQENNYNEQNVRNKMRDYLGIDPYHITIDPQGDYIAHVDCWGKYLAPDKILIARVPQSNPRYPYYEQVAEYFETTNCCWGYPYRVYRVEEPGGNTLAPYTNSLILNHSVYVPLGTNSTYNDQALAVYQEAMPGYTIIGVPTSGNSWLNTDALHCRTRGMMDFDMLFVDHRDVVFGEQEWQESIAVTSKFIAYSGEALKQDSLLVYYSIDGGAYQVAHMTATGNPDEYVGYITGYQGGSEIDYYVFGADESGHRYTQPVFAELDPHHFTMEEHEPAGELIVTPDTLWFTEMYSTKSFMVKNETSDAVTINSASFENGANLQFGEGTPAFPMTLLTGESTMVYVTYAMAPGKDEYIIDAVNLSTTVGERKATLMILNTTLDFGLVVVGSPSIYIEDENGAEGILQNRNFGTGELVKIISIETENPEWLDIVPQHELPYDLEGSEYFTILMKAKPAAKGTVETTVTVESSDGPRTFTVVIDDELLSVIENANALKLYPNPSNGQFTIEGEGHATIFNMLGQKVKEMEVNGKQEVSLERGIYVVRMNESTLKVVVK